VDTIEERTLEAHPIEERTLEAHRTLEACKAAMVAVPSPTARVKPVEGTGIIFAPMCDNFCFTREAVCDHIKNTVPINNLGDYFVFPSKCFHQGYFNTDSDTVYVTAQLFARPTISIASDQLTRSQSKQLDFIQNNLNNGTVTALSNDIFQNWDTTYSHERFGPCKNFDGPVDMDSNRQIPHTKFREAPLLNYLVDTFTEMFPNLTIDMVWLIVKYKPGSGFQSWHQDFNLNEKITKTIVINLGAVKRSDLLGGPLSKVISENKDNEAKVSACDILGEQMLCGFIKSDSEDNEGKVVRVETERREDAMGKRNRKQASQAIKAMKQCGRAAQAAGAGIGAVVVLKVDYRTHSHAQGLMAIVYEINESTGGILVCCEHGVVTHDGSRKDYWVPYDKYDVKARAQDTSPIEEALQSVRNLVLEGKYNSTNQKRISYSKYHEIEIGSSSPVKKGKGCSCKKGCGKNCGCKKKGMRCHSGCFCNGNCCNKGG
jgi:hypothetical protein